jgi:hypothetical protein
MTGTEQIAQLEAQVTAGTTVEDSATTFINGVPGLISTAVAAAVANGATAAQLQPLTDLGAALQAKSNALSAAIVANTH